MNKNYRSILLIAVLLFLWKGISAQESYWVFFKNKNGVQFNPYEYFDAKAIARRVKNDVPINDPTDWPLNENYVNTVRNLVDSISGQTRWFNALAVLASQEQIQQIQQLDFVKSIEMMSYYAIPASINGSAKSYMYYNMRNQQLDILGRKDFAKAGFNGKGVRIAIFDGGFSGVDTSPAFEHIRTNNRLIDDFFPIYRLYILLYSRYIRTEARLIRCLLLLHRISSFGAKVLIIMGSNRVVNLLQLFYISQGTPRSPVDDRKYFIDIIFLSCFFGSAKAPASSAMPKIV